MDSAFDMQTLYPNPYGPTEDDMSKETKFMGAKLNVGVGMFFSVYAFAKKELTQAVGRKNKHKISFILNTNQKEAQRILKYSNYFLCKPDVILLCDDAQKDVSILQNSKFTLIREGDKKEFQIDFPNPPERISNNKWMVVGRFLTPTTQTGPFKFTAVCTSPNSQDILKLLEQLWGRVEVMQYFFTKERYLGFPVTFSSASVDPGLFIYHDLPTYEKERQKYKEYVKNQSADETRLQVYFDSLGKSQPIDKEFFQHSYDKSIECTFIQNSAFITAGSGVLDAIFHMHTVDIPYPTF